MKKKILIIRFSSIGDIVLTTPLLRCIKKQQPEIEIHYLTKKSFQSVLISNPYIDKLILLENDLDHIIHQLKSEKYDLIIDLHRNLRSLWVKFNLETIAYSFNKLNLKKWLLVNFHINILPQKNIVERYIAAAKVLKIKNDHNGLDYFIPQQDIIQISDLPLTHLHGFVVVVLGAAHFTKRIPLNKLMELCENLNAPIILVGGPSEKGLGEKLAVAFPTQVYNTCGNLNINQSASIIKQAKWVITSDTGMMHIAAAFKKKIISIWGNTVPDFGMYPYFGKNENLSQPKTLPFHIIEQKLSCRPCSKIGFDNCPKGHFNCMMQHDMKKVANIITGNTTNDK